MLINIMYLIEYFLGTHGARERLIITFKQSPCNEEIQRKFQKIESPVKVYLINIYNF